MKPTWIFLGVVLSSLSGLSLAGNALQAKTLSVQEQVQQLQQFSQDLQKKLQQANQDLQNTVRRLQGEEAAQAIQRLQQKVTAQTSSVMQPPAQNTATPVVNTVVDHAQPLNAVQTETEDTKSLASSIDLSLSGGLLVLVLALLAWMLWPSEEPQQANQTGAAKKSKPAAKSATQQAGTDIRRRIQPVVSVAEDEAEYDFINSEEGIPAKLNLARAYLDMEEIETAKAILEEVLAMGNKEQRAQARALLNERREGK